MLFIFWGQGSWAQSKIIEYHFEAGALEDIDTSVIKFPRKVDSSFLYFNMLSNVKALQKQSFLAANLDSIVFSKNDTAQVFIYMGQQLKYGNIKWIGLEKEWLSNPKLRKINLSGQLVEQKSIAYYNSAILNELEENGYPLARIKITDKRIVHDSLHATIEIERGPLILLGGLDEPNDSIVSPSFLVRYLNLQRNQAFRMSDVKSIEQQLNQLPYLRLRSTPEIQITGNKAFIKVPLKAIPASRFDFLIGVLPNVENATTFTISGELTADFKNKLKRGEELFVHFRQLKPETQRIDFRAMYPYLLDLPFGIHGSFSLYRNGLESRDLNSEVGIQYRTGKYLESRFFINFQSSRLIDIDTIGLINTRQLPASLDVRLNNLGGKITYDKRDYRFNPRKGLLLESTIHAGIKSIIPNIRITEIKTDNIDFSTAYDSLDLNVFQFALLNELEYYIPIKKSSTIKIGNSSGIKWSQSPLFFNEYYRIGGSGILRGFDEESIRGQYYSVFTAEYRYLLSLNSYFSTFFDYGILYNAFRTSRKWDQPIGFGVGLSFQTNAGIFGLDVAVGRQLGNTLDFRNAKTHFGFISLF